MKKDPNFRLVRFDPKSKEFRREIGFKRKRIVKMGLKERAQYEKWFRKGSHPEVVKALFGAQERAKE